SDCSRSLSGSCMRALRRSTASRQVFTTSRWSQVENCAPPRNCFSRTQTFASASCAASLASSGSRRNWRASRSTFGACRVRSALVHFLDRPLDRVSGLGPEAVVPLLRGRFGTPYRYLESCASTQRLLGDDDPEGAAVVTDHQLEGRGRLGRTWEDTPGRSILMSVLLLPPAPMPLWPE